MKSPRPPLRPDAPARPTRRARPAAPNVSRIAAAVVANLAKTTRYVDPEILRLWPTLAGPEFAALCRPGRLTGGPLGRTLEVVVPHGAAATSVEFGAESLRHRLNDHFGPNAIARILIIQGTGPARSFGLSRFRTG